MPQATYRPYHWRNPDGTWSTGFADGTVVDGFPTYPAACAHTDPAAVPAHALDDRDDATDPVRPAA